MDKLKEVNSIEPPVKQVSEITLAEGSKGTKPSRKSSKHSKVSKKINQKETTRLNAVAIEESFKRKGLNIDFGMVLSDGAKIDQANSTKLTWKDVHELDNDIANRLAMFTQEVATSITLLGDIGPDNALLTKIVKSNEFDTNLSIDKILELRKRTPQTDAAIDGEQELGLYHILVSEYIKIVDEMQLKQAGITIELSDLTHKHMNDIQARCKKYVEENDLEEEASSIYAKVVAKANEENITLNEALHKFKKENMNGNDEQEVK